MQRRERAQGNSSSCFCILVGDFALGVIQIFELLMKADLVIAIRSKGGNTLNFSLFPPRFTEM